MAALLQSGHTLRFVISHHAFVLCHRQDQMGSVANKLGVPQQAGLLARLRLIWLGPLPGPTTNLVRAAEASLP